LSFSPLTVHLALEKVVMLLICVCVRECMKYMCVYMVWHVNASVTFCKSWGILSVSGCSISKSYPSSCSIVTLLIELPTQKRKIVIHKNQVIYMMILYSQFKIVQQALYQRWDNIFFVHYLWRKPAVTMKCKGCSTLTGQARMFYEWDMRWECRRSQILCTVFQKF
jgi:hypothetical protein